MIASNSAWPRRAWRFASAMQPRDWRDLIAVTWSLIHTTVVIRIQSPARVIARATRARQEVPQPDRVETARLIRLADVAGRYLAPVPCLPRSVGMARFLSSRGVPATVEIGVRTIDGRLEAHAWVTSDGLVVNDAAASAGAYAPIDRPLSIDRALTMLLRGDLPAAIHAAGAFHADRIGQSAARHGVTPLIADRLQSCDRTMRPAWAQALIDDARADAAADMVTEIDLCGAIAALDRAGVKPLLFKGAHLAYRDYQRPDLRPRVDADVLIRDGHDAREAADRALRALGYTAKPHVGGAWLMTQRLYVRRVDGQPHHAVDLHWRVSNPQAFARVLTHEELWRDAEPLTALGPAARGPSGPHALLIACLHRVAHHANDDCLIWLHDIDLIARRLTEGEWARFRSLARERRVARVCAASLLRAAAAFGTALAADARALTAVDGRSRTEPSAAYLRGHLHGVRGAMVDLRAAPSWRARRQLAGEYMLPPAAYMRNVYARGSRAPLAWLYIRRLAAAATRAWPISAYSRRCPDPAGSTAIGSD
jgi:hypothetical protein